MSNICPITKAGPKKAGKYANRTRATVFTPVGKTYKYPNLQTKKIFVPELNKSVKVTISTSGLRTIKKNGAYATLKKAKLI